MSPAVCKEGAWNAVADQPHRREEMSRRTSLRGLRRRAKMDGRPQEPRRASAQAARLISARLVCHSGRAATAARAGIYNHRQWLWIPGSRASPAPRNDESEFTRVGIK